MTKRLPLLLALMLAMLATTGCLSLRQPYPEKREFLLEAARPAAESATRPGLVLAVMPVRVSPAFEKRNFVVRLSDGEYEPDSYSVFLVPPARNITGITEAWLRGSGLFAEVVPPDSAVLPTHLVEGNVVCLYGDRRDDPAAVLEIQLALVDISGAEPRVVFQKGYARSEPVDGKAPEQLVAGWNAALASILAEFEADTATALPPAP